MGEAVSIKREADIKLDSFVKNYLNPKYVFLPILKDFKLRVIDNSYVYKNDIVMFTKEGKSVHSSVSGRVLGVKDMLYSDGKKVSSLVIENDFKENIRVRKSAKKYIEHYDKKSLVQILEDTSYMYKGEYVLNKLKVGEEVLLINGVELEPYFGNKYFILEKNAESILETIDLLGEIFEYRRIVLVIKNNDSEIVSNFMNLIGTYPNIELRLVPDGYPNGMNKFLMKELEIKEACVLDITEIISIYNILKKQVPITEKLITITGNAVKPRATIRVKMGTLLSEVFIQNFDFTKECVEVYLNGTMSGELVNTLKYVIDSNIDGLVIMEKTNKEHSECINCGLCSKNCPMGLNPKYVFDHKGRVKEEYKNECLKCGLCNYSCPSNIDLRHYMNGSDEE